MVFVSVGLHAACDLFDLAVHADIKVAFAAQALEELAVVAFALADEGRKDIHCLVGIVVEDHVDDFLLRVFHHLLSAEIAVGRTGACVEQSEVVVDLRRGAHCGAWILVCCFLLDADDGAQSCDLVDIGPLHVAQKVAGVGRKCLYVSALSFGVDGVKGQ